MRARSFSSVLMIFWIFPMSQQQHNQDKEVTQGIWNPVIQGTKRSESVDGGVLTLPQCHCDITAEICHSFINKLCMCCTSAIIVFYCMAFFIFFKPVDTTGRCAASTISSGHLIGDDTNLNRTFLSSGLIWLISMVMLSVFHTHEWLVKYSMTIMDLWRRVIVFIILGVTEGLTQHSGGEEEEGDEEDAASGC